jgi:hypothetical protein
MRSASLRALGNEMTQNEAIKQGSTAPIRYGPTYQITIACPRRDTLTPPVEPLGLLRGIVAVFRNLRQRGTFRHPDSRYWD